MLSNDIQRIYMKKKIDSKTELGSMINLARGNRSLRKYANDAGVSYSTIYMIEKGEYVPSPKMIKKLTSKQANPQNGITYEDVMNAAGYKTEQDEDKVGEKAREMAVQIIVENDRNDAKGRFERLSYEARRALMDQLNDRAKGLIFYALAKAGMVFSNEISDERANFFRRNDLLLSIDKGRIRTWKIQFICTPNGERYMRMNVTMLFSRFLTYPNTKEMKFSVVTNDPSSFAYFKKYEHALAFRGDLSVILVDINVQEILDEVYLSNYFLNDYSDEFHLV